MEFTRDDIKSMLKSINRLCVDKKHPNITVDEVLNSPRLLKYFTRELQSCTAEIVDGTHEAVANDWMADVEEHRTKKYKTS